MNPSNNAWRGVIQYYDLLNHGGHYLEWGYWHSKYNNYVFEAKALRVYPRTEDYMTSLINWMTLRSNAPPEEVLNAACRQMIKAVYHLH